MKGRFRKGKKQYRLTRKNKLAIRYALYLLRVQQDRQQALKLVQASMIIGMGAIQLTHINQQVGVSPVVKAFHTLQMIIESQRAISKLLNQ